MIDPKYKNCHFWTKSVDEKFLKDLVINALQDVGQLRNISWDSLAVYSGIGASQWSAASCRESWDNSEKHQLLLSVLKKILYPTLPQTPLESYL